MVSAGLGFGDGSAHVTNARMYAITEKSRSAWRQIFAWLAEETGVDLKPVEHPPPAPLSDLWARSDLGCVFMCGWPIARAKRRPRILAAPVPLPSRYHDEPIYFTDIVVARDSRFRTIEDTFGGTVGWTLEDSNSGFNMLRHHLLAYRTPDRPLLYSKSVGSLINPLGALRAVAEGQVDVVPVDSFCHDLFLASDHPLTALTRTLHTTPPSPMPALVASPDLPHDVAEALRAALLRAHRAPLLADALQAALVRRFVNVEATRYDYTEALAQAAIAAGYPLPA